MPRPVRVALILLAASPLGGCLATGDPYPVAGNPVNPTPVGRYRVECSTSPSALAFVSGDRLTACRQVDGAAPPLRARG